MISKKYNILIVNKQKLYITFLKSTLRELILFIVNNHISLVFNTLSTFDFIKDKS